MFLLRFLLQLIVSAALLALGVLVTALAWWSLVTQLAGGIEVWAHLQVAGSLLATIGVFACLVLWIFTFVVIFGIWAVVAVIFPSIWE